MKLIIFILIVLLALQSYAWHIDKQCRQYQGWSVYGVFPPSCHVMKEVAPLDELKRLFDTPLSNRMDV